MNSRVLAVLILAATAACAGGPKSRASAKASATADRDSTAFDERAKDDGEPGWVNRGSGAVSTDAKRAFYGVGLANGIKNPSLLRTTADDRARAELAKLLEVFSASLMKDYSASNNGKDEQAVEQAVKTAASASLRGVEIVDRYIAVDGTMYALAQLDLNKAAALIQAAEASGAVKSYVQKVNTDDIFDQNAKKAKAAPPPPKVAANEGSTSANAPPASDNDVKTRRGGDAPAWTDGQDSRWPYATYLCGVGTGPSRKSAENGAYASLSRIFVARVQAVSRDFMGAYSSTGAKPLEVQSSEQTTKVSTDKVFNDVKLYEIWEGKGTTYALACMERAKVSASLHAQIDENDKAIAQHMSTANTADKATQLKELSRALDSMVQRESLNGELRIVDTDGVGVAGQFSHADVAAALETVQTSLKIGVAADGPYASDFRSAMIQGLTQRGYEVSEVESSGSGLDVLVTATIRMEDGGKGTGTANQIQFARGVVAVEVKNLSKGRTIASINQSRKEGHRSLDEAQRRVVRQLGQELVNQVGAKIDDAMKGR
ncbi:MAG: LPP20 family lipoprotein [Clostridia bacterium]|nr:LPP20 family lipoprotein [Deltaproteobacteria bacterium]